MMNASQSRVIDPVLSKIAQGFLNGDLIGSALFPVVPVNQRAGKVVQFGKEAFLTYETARAPGTKVNRIDIGYGSQNFALVDHAISGRVPVELMEEAEAVPGINLASAALETARRALALRLERDQGALATNAALFAASNKQTLSGTSQISDPLGDPITLVEDAKNVIRGKIGVRGNTVIMGAAVFNKIKTNPKVIDRIKYTGRDIPTLELLASLFDVKRVLIGDAIQSDDAGVVTDVWGKSLIVAYTDLGTLAEMGRPSFGYTYQLNGYPAVGIPRYDGDHRQWLYDVFDASQPVIAAADAGFLYSNAVA